MIQLKHIEIGPFIKCQHRLNVSIHPEALKRVCLMFLDLINNFISRIERGLVCVAPSLAVDERLFPRPCPVEFLSEAKTSLPDSFMSGASVTVNVCGAPKPDGSVVSLQIALVP